MTLKNVIEENVFCMSLCATPTIWGQFTNHSIPKSSMLQGGHSSAEIKRLAQGHMVPEQCLLSTHSTPKPRHSTQ